VIRELGDFHGGCDRPSCHAVRLRQLRLSRSSETRARVCVAGVKICTQLTLVAARVAYTSTWTITHGSPSVRNVLSLFTRTAYV